MSSGSLSAFAHAFTMALDGHPRRISPKYLYDAEGSAWFARICELPEYYLTRTEISILRAFGREIAHCIGQHAELIEFGAGPSTKLRVLLDHLQTPMRYCPVDISGEHLKSEARRLKTDHPWLRVQPIEADFMRPFKWPAVRRGSGPRGRRVGMLLGSSLGNFEPDEARAFLCNVHQMMPGGAMLIGVDLVKDPSVLHAAYNDVAGVTAAFNLNLLARANRELNATFDVGRFSTMPATARMSAAWRCTLSARLDRSCRCADTTSCSMKARPCTPRPHASSRSANCSIWPAVAAGIQARSGRTCRAGLPCSGWITDCP